MSSCNVPAWPDYNQWAREYTESYQRCGWASRSSQLARYEAVTTSVPLHNTTLLDIGCGDGEWYGFLKKNQIQTQYKGIDSSSSMIECAKMRFPEGNFCVGYASDYHESVDVITAIGLANHDMPEYWVTLSRWMAHWLEQVEIAVCITFLSSHTPISSQLSKLKYISPQKAMGWGFSLTPFVTLQHGYLNNDFLLVLYKR